MSNATKTTGTSKGLIITIVLLIVCVIGSCLGIGVLGILLENNQKVSNHKNISTENINTSSNRQPEAIKTNKVLDILELAGKNSDFIEGKLKKPKTSKIITDESRLLFDQEKEYSIDGIPDEYLLVVRFKGDKAVQFLFNLPFEMGSQTDIDFAQRFGLNVTELKTEKYKLVTNWVGKIGETEFEKISVMKISSEKFSQITVIVLPTK